MRHSRLLADLSNNNDEFHPKPYKRAGHVIVGLKASEGTSFADNRHRGWTLAAHGQHISVVHYHFGRPDRSSGAEEADFFLEVTNGLRGMHDFLVYDGERASDGQFGLSSEHAAEFDRTIQQRTRFHTILYASASQLGKAREALVGENRRDWIADYSQDRDAPAPGHVTAMRQFTDGIHGPMPHSLPGCGMCDISIMRGQFAARVLHNAR